LGDLHLKNEVLGQETQVVDIIRVRFIHVDQVGDVLRRGRELLFDLCVRLLKSCMVGLQVPILLLRSLQRILSLIELLVQFEHLHFG